MKNRCSLLHHLQTIGYTIAPPQKCMERQMGFPLKKIRDNLLGIGDSPQKIALGFALGLFLGVFPGTGAIAAVVCAVAFRVNKAASLTGALLVNTWINIVAFPLALLIGGALFGIDPAGLKLKWSGLLAHFSWSSLFDTLIINAALAVVAGYMVIGIILAVTGYGISLLIVQKTRKGADKKGVG
jgi:uncharacterized protein (DUF2062 family)